jgi:hypothetical protein
MVIVDLLEIGSRRVIADWRAPVRQSAIDRVNQQSEIANDIKDHRSKINNPIGDRHVI